MDIQRVIESLCELEQKVDVSRLTWEGIAVWPLLREQLCAQAGRPNFQSGDDSPPPPATVAILPRRMIKAARRWWRTRRSFRGLREAARGKLLVATDPTYHTELLGGRRYDRFADPLIEILSDRKFCKIELRPRDIGARHLPPLELDLGACYDVAGRRWRRMGKDALDPSFVIAGYGDLLRQLADIPGLEAPPPDALMKSLIWLQVLSGFLENALQKSRPKIVFVVCYYAPEMRALTLACRRLGIPVFDIQHGKQGRYHSAYTHWRHVPADGWSLLPDVFCVWGEESRHNIESHLPAGCHHRAVVTGNLWMALWTSRSALATDARHDEFLNSLAAYRRRILVSLQPIADPLPTALLEAMKSAPADWIWLIRLHPNMRRQTAAIASRLMAVAPGRFEMDFASQVPLYSELRAVDHHVTGWSSVAYEALAFDVPTTLLHETARDLYRDYITEGLFTFAKNGVDLMRAIEDADGTVRKESRPYIMADRAIARNSLVRLLDETETPGGA